MGRGSRGQWTRSARPSITASGGQDCSSLSINLRGGLTPWRWRAPRGLALPLPRTCTIWSERWQGPEERLQAIEVALQARGARVLRGGDYDRWELEVRGGLFGAARTRMAIEEHGAGKQLVRFRSWSRCSTKGCV